MRRFSVIWCRELAACFLSPVAYVSLVVFLAVSGGTFFLMLYLNAGQDKSLSVMAFTSILLWLPILVTVIGMRLFAEERRSGTLEALMTAPVTEASVVLGKYAGALTFLVLVCAPAVVNLYSLCFLSPGVDLVDIDPGAVSGGCLILFLIASLWMAIGVVMSLLTRHQIVAAVCTFFMTWFVMLLGHIVASLPFGWRAFGDRLSCLEHLDVFARGTLDCRPIVLYVSATWMILFGAVRILEMKRWR